MLDVSKKLMPFTAAKRESRRGRIFEIAAIAGEEGSAAAIRAAKDLESDEGARRTALLGAARYLLSIGEYSKAADLYDEGSTASDSTVPDYAGILRCCAGHALQVRIETPRIPRLRWCSGISPFSLNEMWTTTTPSC